MIVEPYKRNPAPPRVAVLTEAAVVVDEDGERIDADEVPQGTRVFAQWDVIRLLMQAGIGEALCWNNEEIRWRFTPRPEQDEWKRSSCDVYVIRLPLTELLTPAVFLRGVVGWRDWLASSMAAPTGTTGSSAMSLLRSRLGRKLVCGMGERPPLASTRGGRMQLGPGGPGRYEGKLILLDMPSAYASLLGEAYYGGVWQQTETTGRRFDYWLEDTRPLFVRADITVPAGLEYGPVCRFFPRRVHQMEMQVYSRATYPDGGSWLYPTGRKLSGVWTRAELHAAADAGCKIRLRDAWIHRSSEQPFAPWWETVQEGRLELAGAGELLSKMTGNALWGRFALDARIAGRRTIRSAAGARELKHRPSPPPAHDLAEHVSGTVRGRLYQLMVWAGDRLLSANTDGAWIRDNGSTPPDGWRIKARAHRLDLLGPACLRYTPERSRWPRVVYAGVPAIEADTMFERDWQTFQAAA